MTPETKNDIKCKCIFFIIWMIIGALLYNFFIIGLALWPFGLSLLMIPPDEEINSSDELKEPIKK